MNWLKKKMMQRKFNELVAKAGPMTFSIDPSFKAILQGECGSTVVEGLSISTKPYLEIDDGGGCNHVVNVNLKVRDYNGDEVTLTEFFPMYDLTEFSAVYARLKRDLEYKIRDFYSSYGIQRGYYEDAARLKALNINDCINCNCVGERYLNTWIYSDFKRAMLYFQSLEREGVKYLDNYKAYIFNHFKQALSDKGDTGDTCITADEPCCKYSNYSYWLITYQQDLDKQAEEKDIEGRVEHLDQLLTEINNA